MDDNLKNTIGRVAGLRAMIESIEGKAMSEETFVARFLPYSSTVWSRVNSGNYKGNLETVARKLNEAADSMQDRLDAIRRRVETAGTFAHTRFALSVIGAHRRALDDGDGCRIVVALAPTGAGKTTIARWLAGRHDAVYVEGRQSWKSSHKAFCLDVARAAGKALTGRHVDERQSEDAVFDALGSRHGTLIIDEANTLRGAVANTIKRIVNRTNHAVVVFAVPEHWDEFAAANTNEVKQVINRCQAVLRYPELPAADVDGHFLGKGFAGDRAAACRRIADAANSFGAYKTVKRVCDILNGIDGATDGDAEKAVATVRLSQDNG